MQTLSSSRFPIRQLLVWTLLVGLFIPVTGIAGGGQLIKQNTDKTKVISGETPAGQLLYTEGNLVVKLISPDSIDIGVVNAQFGTTVDRYLGNLRLYLLHLPTGANPDSLAAQISQLTWVEYVHPNYMTDPLNPVQGSYPFPDLQHVGNYDDQAASTILQLPSVHQDATGAGVVVGVLDGGVDYAHPELSGHVVSGWDYVDQDADAMDEPGGDNSGHGTFVAGVIGLIAPDATIRAYRVVDIDGTSDGYVLAEAIMQAVDDGCDVINLSLAMQLPHEAVGDAIAYARSQGTVVVAAAGNGNEEVVRYPASDINTIAVAAVDSLNHLAEFSNYGGGVDVCAPGAWIYSPYQDEGYAWWDGTSFASPFVAGQAALLRELNPVASVSRIRDAIKGTADDLDSENPGYADKLGSGLINPLAAIDAVLNGDSAWITPDTLHFSMPYSDRYYTADTAFISSTNAPAFFSGTISHASSSFASLLDTSNFTNAPVRIGVWPGSLPAPGTYYATATYTVDGVIGPVELVIELTLTPDTTIVDSAWTFPSVINYTVSETNTDTLTGCITIQSTNAPASFFAYNEVPGIPPYVRLLDSAGMTPDSICFTLAPIGLSPGMYGDSVYFWVDGILDPVKVPIWVTVTADSSGGGAESAWATPSTMSITAVQGTAPIYRCATVHATNHPAAFQAYGSTWISVADSMGITGDSSCFAVIIGNRSPGTYSDTAFFLVDGIGQPATVVLSVTILPDSSGGGGDSVVVIPSSLNFTMVEGSAGVTKCFSVFSSNQPAAYTVTEMSFSPLGIFTYIDSGGVTPDSSCVTVAPGLLSPGTYCEPLAVTVAGIAEPFTLNVCLTVLPDSSGGGAESAWINPPYAEVTVTEGNNADSLCFVVNSTHAPADYWIFHDTDSILQVGLVPQTGMVQCVDVLTAGLPVGLHCDSLFVIVDGIADTLNFSVCVNVLPGGGDTSSTVSSDVSLVGNYPNPFNPETNISFMLPRAMAVELSVYNVLGQHITTLVDRPMAAGEHVVVWDGRDSGGRGVASGIYFYRLTTETTVATRKMLLLK